MYAVGTKFILKDWNSITCGFQVAALDSKAVSRKILT